MPEPQSAPQPTPPPDAGHVPMSEEFDRAKWTLPPIVPLLIGAAAVAIVLFGYAFHASKPLARGKILSVDSADQGDQQHVIVAVALSIDNLTEKPLWVKDVVVQLKPTSAAAPLEDQGASVADFARYFKAFPTLATHQMDAMANDTKIAPGATAQGLVIVAFPVSKDAFDKRQWLRVRVEPYDHQPFTVQ